MHQADIHYQQLMPDTISPLQDCIRRTYGDSYPFHWFYDRAAIEQLLDDGKLISVIALNNQERVVGTIGILLATPHNSNGDYSADSIAAMVDEDYRGHDVMMQLGVELFQAFKQYALAGVHLYALPLHDVVQKHSMQEGRAAITGILPAYFNRDTHVAGFDTGGHRIGAVVLFQPVFTAAPQRSVYLPAPYAEVLQSIYDTLPLPRSLCATADINTDWYQLPQRSACELKTEVANRESKLRVIRIGEDLADKLVELKQQMIDDKLEVLYVDFAVNDTAIEQAVTRANAQGFGFGALIPERYHTDWLRLQYYKAEDVSLQDMVVAPGSGKVLLEFVGEDGERVRAH